MDDVERLLAERACERLIMEYARRVDFGNASGIADLFTVDARWEGTNLLLDGQDEIRAWFTKREAVTRRVSRHLCVNVMVDVLSRDEAQAMSLLVNYRHDRREGDTTLPVPVEVPKYIGELHDRFRRTPDGWRFSGRRVELAFVRRRGGG